VPIVTATPNANSETTTSATTENQMMITFERVKCFNMLFTYGQRSRDAAAALFPIAQGRTCLHRHTLPGVMQMPTIDPTEFDVRWADWIARGRVHEARARRRFVIGFAVLTAAAAAAYLIVR